MKSINSESWNKNNRLIREAIWIESIAVGSEAFLKEIAAKTKKRLYIFSNEDGDWYEKENNISYK